MASYTAEQLNGAGTPTEVLSGAKTFTLTNPATGSAYFTVETVRNATGSYANRPTNAIGTYATFVGLDANSLVTSSYISSIVVYGNSATGELNEDTPVNSSGGNYVQTKILSEHALLQETLNADIELIIIRPGDV